MTADVLGSDVAASASERQKDACVSTSDPPARATGHETKAMLVVLAIVLGKCPVWMHCLFSNGGRHLVRILAGSGAARLRRWQTPAASLPSATMELHVLPMRNGGAAENMALDFLLLQRYPAAAIRFRQQHHLGFFDIDGKPCGMETGGHAPG